jgi:hypothetical protein
MKPAGRDVPTVEGEVCEVLNFINCNVTLSVPL